MDATELREGFDGTLLSRDDAGYDEARVDLQLDDRPPPGADRAVRDRGGRGRRARPTRASEELEIAVRGGGHSVAGAGAVDGGLVIDMRRMNAVEIDPEARIARVGGGATWGDFDRAGQPHGLATTGGRVSTTGVAGLTLGGGSGWLERKYGARLRHLESVDL